MMVQLAEVSARLHHEAIAAQVYDCLLPHREVWVIEGIGAGIRGPADRALAQVAVVLGEEGRAIKHFESARRAATDAGARFLAAVIDHEQGVALGERDRIEAARPLRAAFGGSEPEELVSAPPVAAPNRWKRDGETWSVTFNGTTSSLRASKGMRDLATLLAAPGREVAALDLVAAGGTVVQGTAGPALDARAREAYRSRLAEIEAELDEADHAGDLGRSTALHEERDALVHELTGAYGLGGRDRATGASAERARTAVRSRIRDALRRIEAADERLARHLDQSVRTGTFCVYDPETPVRWVVED
jgi:hypothetical protein